jgi:hypothetical protein
MSVDVGIEGFLDLGSSISNKLDRIHDRLAPSKPNIKTVAGSTVLTAATGTVEITERPSAGKIWNILKVLVLNVDGHTPLAGVIVDVYASALADIAAPALDNLIVSGGTGNVPSITFYSRQVEWCSHGEEIFGQIYGGTIGQQIVLLARVAEYEYSSVQRMSI